MTIIGEIREAEAGRRGGKGPAQARNARNGCPVLAGWILKPRGNLPTVHSRNLRFHSYIAHRSKSSSEATPVSKLCYSPKFRRTRAGIFHHAGEREEGGARASRNIRHNQEDEE